ncbi:MAG: family 20 glycosylhydrolase [Ktedonobacteraceae bacterium]
MRKRIIVIWGILLLGIVIIFITIVPAGLLDLSHLLASPNPVPTVIPGLREWHGSSGLFTSGPTSRIIVDLPDAAQLEGTTQVFQRDLFSVSGHMLPILTTGAPQTGDFYLTLSNADRGLGSEGYLLSVGDFTTISARTNTGVFYGTRTVLQILVQDGTRAHLPKGIARDYPRYQERAFMLDAGRKFFPISFLEDYVKFMSWYKMNDFHIHFNDNQIGGGDSPDWKHSYAAFRLNSDRFKGLAARDGSYTRQDIQALETVASAYAVTITPEIDAPAHALALTQYRPDLASPQYSKDFLDLGNPHTYTFMNAIWDEFLPWFSAKQIDIGADEYAQSDADRFRQYINTYDDYLRRKGKTTRMWGSLTQMQSAVKVNTDIVIDVWNNRWANPIDMVNQGFHIINANDNLLYIVPKAGYYHDYLDSQMLYEKWEPNIFDFANPALNLRPDDPHLLGGMFAVWNDKLGGAVTDAEVHERVKPAMQALSQKLWSGTTGGVPYDEFVLAAWQIGDAPGTHLPPTQPPGGVVTQPTMGISLPPQ